MRIIIDSTDETGTIQIDGVKVPARIWRTQDGNRVLALITRVIVEASDPGANRDLVMVDEPTGIRK